MILFGRHFGIVDIELIQIDWLCWLIDLLGSNLLFSLLALLILSSQIRKNVHRLILQVC